MREKLHKAKRTDNGKWVDGGVLMSYSNENCYIIQNCLIDKDDVKDGLYGFDCLGYVVDRETVCQYTGIEDKNKKEIFENDILKISNEVDNGILAVVKFGEYNSPFCSDNFGGHLGFYLEFQEKNDVLRKDFLYWCKNEYIEVVGNIFDNPELLEAKA